VSPALVSRQLVLTVVQRSPTLYSVAYGFKSQMGDGLSDDIIRGIPPVSVSKCRVGTLRRS
jgi:hypothetical protein